MTDLSKVAYDSFIRECGYAKDARIMEFSKLPMYIRSRWNTIARDIIKAKEANDAKPTRTRAKKPRRIVS